MFTNETTTAAPVAVPEVECGWGGVTHPPASVFDVDGAWCSDRCQSLDRQSEWTWLRRARAGAVAR